MTQDEIRKLLGGYATNALSPDERRILFEAALEDQDLFNALENEDALKELLADPATREQVRNAIEAGRLERSHSSTSRAAFSWRRWIYAVAMPAVAAIVVIAVMNRTNAPGPAAPQTVRVAAPAPLQPPELAPKLETAAPNAKEQVNVPRRIARSAAAPAIAASDQLEAERAVAPPQAKSYLVAARAPLSDAVRQQFTVASVAGAPLYQGPLVRYSIIRGGSNGQELRLDVSTHIAGYLALYHLDAAGNYARIYPLNDVAAPVVPDVTIQIPNSPIKIADAGPRLRLVVVPTTPQEVIGQLGGAVNGVVLGTGNAITPAPPAPLVVDIPLGPN